MLVVLVAVAAFGLAAFTYLYLERLGGRAWVPLFCRGIGWTALGLLLVNVSCPVAGTPQRALTLLDASLSMGVAGGHWEEASDSARSWGDVRPFGDERASRDSTPTRGRSLLAPALLAASASDRPLIVVTDGEIEDLRDIPPDLLARTTIKIFPRSSHPDLAITRVTGPGRITSGDSIHLQIHVQTAGGDSRDTVAMEVTSGEKRLARRTIRLKGEGSGQARIALASGALAAGDHLLRVSLVGPGDAEFRTDARLHRVTIAPTPGVVLLAAPGDWDSRFLYRTLREVSQLPVRGFVRIDPERWRSMADLSVVPVETVRQAARRADLLIQMGPVGALAEGTAARGLWRWRGGSDSTALPGDWYLHPGDASPLAGAFLGAPVDSFPPAIQITPLQPEPGGWVALTAQLGRRGAPRPAVFGGEAGRVRRVTVAVDGLWRWAFRGGSSEQSYRTWVAATASWLLGGADSTRGSARPLRTVVENGRPVLFEWVAPGPPAALGIAWSGAGAPRADTLRFDGNGRAAVWLPPGEYRYRLTGGGGGAVAVETYSEELVPRPVALGDHQAPARAPSGRSAARDWLWLFGLCILG